MLLEFKNIMALGFHYVIEILSHYITRICCITEFLYITWKFWYITLTEFCYIAGIPLHYNTGIHLHYITGIPFWYITKIT